MTTTACLTNITWLRGPAVWPGVGARPHIPHQYGLDQAGSLNLCFVPHWACCTDHEVL